MERFLKLMAVLLFMLSLLTSIRAQETVHVNDSHEPMKAGKFEPTWKSLEQYQVPDWFRDAKFGIWAHWGPQCGPEAGDWYARQMYSQGHWQYDAHLKKYGHPSQVGFKDVIHQWQAENWNPDELVALYKRAGAQYFFAMANHHDNFDMWGSKYQPWNSVALGSKKNLIAGWAKAAREQGLRFGVSVHAAHAWSWYETSQAANSEGPLKGVAYDGKLTAADGHGKWWDGFDPQDLYEQRHAPSPGFTRLESIHSRWYWDNGCSVPDQAYCNKFYNRCADLIDKYEPDLLYFDDTALPLWPVSDAGLKIAAHYYNSNMANHDGKLEAVLFGKILDQEQRKCMVWDIERGASNVIEPFVFQTDTCIGGWHYDRGLYERRGYKSATTVVHMLADIVSKNGNLLLNIPVRADGSIDEIERQIVESIGKWNAVNGEAIFGTRPWKVFGEGPALAEAAELTAQGFNEGKGKPYTPADVRFTTKDGCVYAILLGLPTATIRIESFGGEDETLRDKIKSVELIGSHESVQWQQADEALTVEPPAELPCEHAVVYKITLAK